jgi:hypothetical protein
MLISAREAAFRLHTAVGVTRRQACLLLGAGLAGEAMRTPSATLYDEAAVESLASWTALTDDQADAACPFGLFIARADCGVWGFSPWTSVWIHSRIERHGHLPFVSTLCGFVISGGEITRTIPERGGYRLELRGPGAWYEQFVGHRLPTGRGRPWVIRGWRPYARTGHGNSHGKLAT